MNIFDDGTGIASLTEPEGHYGLNIMHERAARLGGELTISRPDSGGTLITMNFRSPPGDLATSETTVNP
ncbi:nitrate/nitrite sensor protein NarQ [compost metagenome]